MTKDTSAMPIVRLKPKADARAVRHGMPWVYVDDLVTDRRFRALRAGSLAVLEDAERQPMALAAVNPGSKIAVRVLSREPATIIDQAWFAAKLDRALALREALFDAPFYRLIHAEADGLPGIVVDRFGEILVMQPNAAWAEMHLDALCAAMLALPGVTTVIKSASGRARKLEGLDDQSACLAGVLPDAPVPVPMNGATYLADLTGGQKTGLFFDQRANHAFVAKLARGRRMLDVFAHVGGFGLAALAQGAESVTAVDSSAAALALASEGAARAGVSRRFSAERADAFDALQARAESGERFDVVVVDPPAFAPNKPSLEKGLRAYERLARLAAPLVEPGGFLCLCSCSHAADLSKFRAASIRGIGRAGREARLIHTGFAAPDHPVHPQLAESGYLKALVFAL